MPPTNWTLIAVTGTYLDSTGAPCTGVVVVSSAVAVVVDGQLIVPKQQLFTLDASGSVSFSLPSTNDPDIAPTGWVYQITEAIKPFGRPRYQIAVPYTSPGINLATVVPAVPVDPTVTYLDQSDLGVTVPPLIAGLIPAQYLPGGAATWGAINGTLANQTDLATALGTKLDVSAVGTAASHDVPATGNASAAQCVLGNDSRLGGGPGGVAWGAITGTLADQTDLNAALAAKANDADLAAVAFSGRYADLSGTPTSWSWGSISGTPTTLSGYGITDAATAAQGAKADSAVQPGALATVATTGAYGDLSGRPTIPAAQVNADWTAVSGVAKVLNKPTLGSASTHAAADFATAAQGAEADTALQPGDVGTAAYAATSAFATAAQGAKADSAVQPGALGSAAYVATTTFATAAQGSTADTTAAGLSTHEANHSNPHVVTAAQVGAPTITGATALAVVTTLPGTPDSGTLYFVTT